MKPNETIIVLDFGGQYNQLIARKVREANVYCEILPCNASTERIKQIDPQGIVVLDDQTRANAGAASTYSRRTYELGIPILHICYNTQRISMYFGGKTVGTDVKFHPEVFDTQSGNQILKNFLYEICGCSGQWTMANFAHQSIKELRIQIGDKKVLCGLSGGVDSSVAAILLHKAVGSNLICIFVDHGLLRKDEGDQVEEIFKEQFQLNLIRVNAQERFLSRLRGVSDPETKRKIIGEEFIRVFEEEAKKIGTVDYLVQGTIYSDVVESGAGDAAMIKSHHNVGGLPEHIDFKEIIEPLKYLFKDEVRKLGEELGIPKGLVWRQPFPGPGLAIRIIGDITEEKLEILRESDAVFRYEIAKADLDREIWQYFAVLTDMRSVGIAENKRTYDYTIALRAVTSIDAMTADWARIPHKVLDKISKRIIKDVRHVNRVVYDITGKPPATIEWE